MSLQKYIKFFFIQLSNRFFLFSGIILNSIIKKYSLRTGGLIGAVLLCTGSFSTVFISNTNQLPITFGVFQGIGFGIMVPVCYSTLNYYFVRRRTTVMSICKAIQGVLLMWYPQLIKKIMSVYGFRETLFLLAGMSLHTFPGMLSMITDKKKPRNIRTASIFSFELCNLYGEFVYDIEFH